MDQSPDEAKQSGRILIVDDERNIRTSLKMLLADEGFSIDLAGDGEEAEAILAVTPPDIILLDVRLPGLSGLELLKRWKIQKPALPIVLMSGEATVTEALDGLKDGAYDFVEKPFVARRLINTVRRALERNRLKEESPDADDEPLIGRAAALRLVLADIEKIAPTKTRVLITGESGTGKDLLARAIHRLSARRAQRFLKINCAAIPSELIESELFGHVKGAFTGATAARRGHFEAANGGTLFLDEIGDLSASAQAKILRALQNGEVTPVGSNITIRVDVRVVAATNRDLKAAVEAGSFREDLFYRLAVVTLESPPLRRRSADVPLLIEHFAAQIRQENGLPFKKFEPAVVEAMTAYRWPGNIRELKNAVERLMILGGPVIGVADLSAEIRQAAGVAVGSASDAVTLAITSAPHDPGAAWDSWETFKVKSERAYLIATLKHCDGNISEAARLLEIERSTVHKWFKSLQIEKHHYSP